MGKQSDRGGRMIEAGFRAGQAAADAELRRKAARCDALFGPDDRDTTRICIEPRRLGKLIDLVERAEVLIRKADFHGATDHALWLEHAAEFLDAEAKGAK